MSNETTVPRPMASASAAAATAPPAGPDSTMAAGRAAARSNEIRPPDERITVVRASTCSARRRM